MSDAFFLPVGRNVTIVCMDGHKYTGELKGVINFGGIPAIWIQTIYSGLSNDQASDIVDHICLIQNVISVEVIKEKSKIIDGGLFV